MVTDLVISYEFERQWLFDIGLAFDDWDLDYYTALFQSKICRNPSTVECFDLAQSNRFLFKIWLAWFRSHWAKCVCIGKLQFWIFNLSAIKISGGILSAFVSSKFFYNFYRPVLLCYDTVLVTFFGFQRRNWVPLQPRWPNLYTFSPGLGRTSLELLLGTEMLLLNDHVCLSVNVCYYIASISSKESGRRNLAPATRYFVDTLRGIAD